MRYFTPIAGTLLASALFAGALAAPAHAAPAQAAPALAAPAIAGPVASAPAVGLTRSLAAARPGNGKILYAGVTGGYGRLTIKNGLSKDAVITLVRGSRKAISIYVRARSTAKLKNIKDGTYRIYFTNGYRYHTGKRRFTKSATYQRFNDRLRYTTTFTSDQVLYRTYSLTLHAVPGGNARTSGVNPGDFPT